MWPSGSEQIRDPAVGRTRGTGAYLLGRGRCLFLGLWMRTAQLIDTKKQRYLRPAVRSAASLRPLTFPPLPRLPTGETLRSPINPRLDSHPSRWTSEVQRGFCFSGHSFVPLSFLRCLRAHNAPRIPNGTVAGSGAARSNQRRSEISHFSQQNRRLR